MNTEPIDYADLDKRFSGHYVSQDGVSCLDSNRAAGRAMALAVLQVTPSGRERALALTKIEEAVFWANAAVAREG